MNHWMEKTRLSVLYDVFHDEFVRVFVLCVPVIDLISDMFHDMPAYVSRYVLFPDVDGMFQGMFVHVSRYVYYYRVPVDRYRYTLDLSNSLSSMSLTR
jgi:hypothetical protein